MSHVQPWQHGSGARAEAVGEKVVEQGAVALDVAAAAAGCDFLQCRHRSLLMILVASASFHHHTRVSIRLPKSVMTMSGTFLGFMMLLALISLLA